MVLYKNPFCVCADNSYNSNEEIVIPPYLPKEEERNYPKIFINIGTINNVELKATIPLIFNDIQYKPRTNLQFDATFEKLKPWLSDFLQNAGHIIYGGFNEKEVLKKVEWSFKLTYFIVDPNKFEETSPQMKFLLMWFINALLMDDLMENKNIFKSKKTKSKSKSSSNEVAQVASDILSGKYTSMEKLPKGYPSMLPLLQALYIIQTVGKELIPGYKENVQYLIKECTDSLEANKILSEEWKNENEEVQIPHNTFDLLREQEVGALFAAELIALASGITLNTSERNNALLKHLMRLNGSISAHFNDIIGLKRDLDDNSINSIIYRTKVSGMSLQESLKYAVDKFTSDGNEFKIIAARLKSLENKRLYEFISIMETFLHGTMIGLLHSKQRYNFEDIQLLEQAMANLNLIEAVA